MHTAKKYIALLSWSITLGALVHSPHAYAAKDPEALFEAGVKFALGNNFKKAEKNFKKVIQLAPDSYPAHFNLSLTYFHQKNYTQSLKYWQITSSLNPVDVRVKKLLSSTYTLLNKYGESLTILQELSKQDPADIFTRKKLGIVYLNTGNVQAALAEFTMAKNLSPSNLNGNLLLSAAFALNNNFDKALQKFKSVREQVTDEQSLAFYAYLLEKNNLNEDAEALYKKVKSRDTATVIPNMVAALEQSVIANEAAQIPYIMGYENLEISRRMAEKIGKEQLPEAAAAASAAARKRPLGLKVTVTEKLEHYNRRPRTSSPINGLNVTSTVKMEGRTQGGTNVSGEWEGFYNRWDSHHLDFYKINANKRNDFDVNAGKFSAKYFPTLVSHPTVLEGARFWKKISLPAFTPTAAGPIDAADGEPVNLGEMYRANYVDDRLFKEVETTFVVGRTKDKLDFGERREKNENTFESSGQFEQWTQSYRAKAKLNSFFEVGSTASMTQDITNKTIVTSGTEPIESIALGIDSGLDLLDGRLTADAELAYGNFDNDTFDMASKHARDLAWLFKSSYKMFKTVTLDYEQKAIGRSFKVEGASQTQDKTSHTIDLVYKPENPMTWFPQSHSVRFQPEIVSPDGGGTTKQRYTTIQSVTDFKLPQDSKYILDYKNYREIDKCHCTNYTTTTLKNSLECNFKAIQTVIKPSYTFERKNDLIASPTDEKMKEYIFNIENTTIQNLELDYSFERERKTYRGATTKSYVQYTHSIESKYTFIPSRLDAAIKLSNDYKNPTDTNKTIVKTWAVDINYTSKTGDDILNLKYESKDNLYFPWSDSSAYRQRYIMGKYTRKF